MCCSSRDIPKAAGKPPADAAKPTSFTPAKADAVKAAKNDALDAITKGASSPVDAPRETLAENLKREAGMVASGVGANDAIDLDRVSLAEKAELAAQEEEEKRKAEALERERAAQVRG